MENLKKMYEERFGEDIIFRKEMYKILCKDFFQKYVPLNSVVLDVAAGYCEFINSINARKKMALDLNPDVRKFANDDVEVFISSSTKMKGIKNNSVDVVFVSNFFEHLTRQEITETLKEIFRVLVRGGHVLILQPNIRYCYKDYWMFFDHVTPLDDRSLSEALSINGFKVVECNPRFLPYSTKGILPNSLWLLKLYLKLPFVHPIFGKQAFIRAQK